MRELEEELEEERKQRGQASGSKKKLEGELKDMEDQMEATSRARDESVKQLRKIQVRAGPPPPAPRSSPGPPVRTWVKSLAVSPQGQVKDLQRELEDSRAAQKEVLASAREAERRSKALEADVIQLQEVSPPPGETGPSAVPPGRRACLTPGFSPFLQMLAAADRARKQAETERDELSEELASNSSGKWVSPLAPRE